MAIPYEIHKDVKMYATSLGTSIAHEVTKAIISHIPKRGYKNGNETRCPYCNLCVKMNENEFARYCHGCGQRIEWE